VYLCQCKNGLVPLAGTSITSSIIPISSTTSTPSSTNYASTFTRGKNDGCWKFFKREAVVVQTREGVVVVESLEVGMAIQRVVVAKLLQ
jgi:hypothetical protein